MLKLIQKRLDTHIKGSARIQHLLYTEQYALRVKLKCLLCSKNAIKQAKVAVVTFPGIERAFHGTFFASFIAVCLDGNLRIHVVDALSPYSKAG